MLSKILPDSLFFGKRITHRILTRALVQLIRDFATIGLVVTPGTGRDNRKSAKKTGIGRASCDTQPIPVFIATAR